MVAELVGVLQLGVVHEVPAIPRGAVRQYHRSLYSRPSNFNI